MGGADLMTDFTQPSGDFLIPKGESCACGPYALALTSGRSPEYVKEWVRWNLMRNRGLDKRGRRKAVRSMWMHQLVRFLNVHGIGTVGLDDYTWKGRKHNPTLTQWFKHRSNKEGTYIILLGRHFIVVRGEMVICRAATTWTNMKDKRRLKSARVWQVVELYY
jgi:hypothetical protein